MIAFYDHNPSTLEAVGNGSFLYRWDIVEVSIQEEESQTTQWKCQEVTIWSPITANKITEAVIGELWDINYEQKLVNEYNAALLGVYNEEKASEKIDNYKAFLSERDVVKAKVDEDCKKLGL